MIIGQLTLIKETIPQSFGDFKYLIEKDGIEIARIPSSLKNDLLMVGVNPSDIFYEIFSLVSNTINNPVLNSDIEEIIRVIIND